MKRIAFWCFIAAVWMACTAYIAYRTGKAQHDCKPKDNPFISQQLKLV